MKNMKQYKKIAIEEIKALEEANIIYEDLKKTLEAKIEHDSKTLKEVKEKIKENNKKILIWEKI